MATGKKAARKRGHHEHGHDDPAAVAHEHRVRGPRAVGAAVVTVSDSKTAETDRGGPAVRNALLAAGHTVAWTRIVKDERDEIRAAIQAAVADPSIGVVILTGGTGITSRDVTVEVVESLLDKHLAGFGELFRFLSFQEIGSAAMFSRATAGVIARKAVFALPGSPSAVRLAMEKLIVPELSHLGEQLSR